MNPQVESNTNGSSSAPRNYWRSIDHVCETPEFSKWLASEFPAGAQELVNSPDRRQFLKLMSASFMLAGVGAAGCRRPVEEIIPFGKATSDYTHGVAKYFATARPTRGGAIPLIAKSYEGRPIKLEGNDGVPGSLGATDALTQASILNLYDPDRSQKFLRDGQPVSRDLATTFLVDLGAEMRSSNGAGFAFLWDGLSGPTRHRLIAELGDSAPEATHYHYDPFVPSGSSTAQSPVLHLSEATTVLTLGADILGVDDRRIDHIHGFASGRAVESPEDSMNRLYSVESEMSVTGANSDHRLRVSPSEVERIAAAIAAKILVHRPDVANDNIGDLLASLEELAGTMDNVHSAWIEACAEDLHDHGSTALVVAGQDQPQSVQLIAKALNVALGSVGSTVRYPAPGQSSLGSIEALRDSLNANAVDTLVIVGGNPVYNAPGDLNWGEAQKKARRIIRLSEYNDETSGGATWSLPQAHFLESWGDGLTADGRYVSIQPLVQPLYDGISDIELLGFLTKGSDTNARNLVQETFRARLGARYTQNAWRKALHDGFFGDIESDNASGETFDWVAARRFFRDRSLGPELGDKEYELAFLRDTSVDDGSFANNGWMQEAPDPITKLTWDNAIQVSRNTADSLSVKSGDVVRVKVGGGEIEGPIWIQPGFAEKTIGLTLGYGRRSAGRVGDNVGYDAFPARSFENPLYRRGFTIEPTSAKTELVSTQDHGTMDGRAIVREANLSQFRDHPEFANSIGIESHARNEGALYKHPYESYEEQTQEQKAGKPIVKSDVHQWGMTIDLNRCVGCNACVVACQSENNIPIVGKQQVANGREMHWMRIDRYYTADSHAHGAEALDEPQVANQPMLCQHCENAPCESVCPVNATVHDEEGLNVMAYNRCVGTRYCSNNCPYKVRRFNFFDYKKKPLDKLYFGPLASRPKEEIELDRLVNNPDVTVRMRGVMEKCTFCVQRLETAKIGAKVAARDSDDVRVPDGGVKTACQQVCPAGAIEFGNLLDPESRVSLSKKSTRNYNVLGYLETRPRTTYLARVRNPNVKMPDATEMPYSLSEYAHKAHVEDPLDAHHGGGHDTDHSEEGHSEGGTH